MYLSQSHAIIVGSLKLYFCFCVLPGHMVRVKESLMDINEHCLNLFCPIFMFCAVICIHVCEHVPENLMHQGIVNLKCINLVVKVDPVTCFLILLEVCL